jgi:hypothetical protein
MWPPNAKSIEHKYRTAEHTDLLTGHRDKTNKHNFVERVTRRMSHVEQELLTFPGHLFSSL